MSFFGMVFLLLFGATLFGMYLAIRRGLIETRIAASLGAVISIVALFAYGMAEDLSLGHALISALLVGLIFSGAAAIMATFFKVNEPGALEKYLPDEPRHMTND